MRSVTVAKGLALRAGHRGSLLPMFELSTSYLNASGWMVDSCMATNGEEAMLPCFSVQWYKVLECLLVDGGFGGACSEREGEGGREREREKRLASRAYGTAAPHIPLWRSVAQD